MALAIINILSVAQSKSRTDILWIIFHIGYMRKSQQSFGSMFYSDEYIFHDTVLFGIAALFPP